MRSDTWNLFLEKGFPKPAGFPARRVRAVYEQTTDCIDRG